MFDDITKQGPKKFNAKLQCPACRSYSITKYGMYMTIDDRYEQEAKCNVCNHKWYIRYSEDMSQAHTSPISVEDEASMYPFIPYV